MLAACREHVRWIDVFCERGAFDADQSRAVLEAGRAAGLGLRIHANQLGYGAGVKLAVELGAASADHCTYLDDGDLEALAGIGHGRDVPARDRLRHTPAVPGRPPRDRRGRVGGDRDEHEPGLELHDLDGLLHRARRPRPAHDARGSGAGGDGRRRASAAPRRHRPSAPGCRADAVVLDAPSPAHLAYRPGVPLIAATLAAGEVEFVDPALIDWAPAGS